MDIDLDLLARTLTILASEASPHLREWGGKAAEAALKSVAGEKAKQAAEALGWLKPKIEEKPIAKASVETLADQGHDDDDEAEAEDTLRKHLARLLKADQDLAARLLEKLDGVDVRAGQRSVAAGRDLKADQVVTGGTVIRVTGGNVYLVQAGAAPAQAAAAVETESARDAYLRWVMERAGFLALGGVDPAVGSEKDRRLPLSAVYTALATRTPRRAETELHSGPDHDAALRKAAAQRDEPPLSALEQLDRHQRLVLLGDPGSGKSTFVDFVALCMAGEIHPGVDGVDLDLLTSPLPEDDGSDADERQPWSHGPLLPVRVVLRDFAARGLPADAERPTAEHLWSFLEAELRKARQSDFLPLLEPALKEGKALVLLDGLDEVPEAESRRKLICEAVAVFVEAYPDCRFVVTSRTYAYQKRDIHLEGFDAAELAPFGDGQIRRFTRRWYAEVAELKGLSQEEAKDRAALLERAVFSSARLRELAARPLLLTLTASLHAFRGGSLPEDREKLYDETLELLLDVWEQQQKRHEGGRPEIDPSLLEYLKVERKEVLRELQELAYEVHGRQPVLEGTADIPAGDLVARLMRLTPKTRDTDVNPKALADYLSRRSGILAERGEGVVRRRVERECVREADRPIADRPPDDQRGRRGASLSAWRGVGLPAPEPARGRPDQVLAREPELGLRVSGLWFGPRARLRLGSWSLYPERTCNFNPGIPSGRPSKRKEHPVSSHTHFLYHIVFSTKEREPLITPEARDLLYSYIGGIIRRRRGICIEIGGVMDHVHILARLRPSIAVSKTVQDIKGISSSWAKGRLRTTKALYWQEGYGGFSVSKSQAQEVINYIRNQEAHHANRSFEEEFVELLDKHEIEYDPHRLWD